LPTVGNLTKSVFAGNVPQAARKWFEENAAMTKHPLIQPPRSCY
jgi:hypothetical protein